MRDRAPQRQHDDGQGSENGIDARAWLAGKELGNGHAVSQGGQGSLFADDASTSALLHASVMSGHYPGSGHGSLRGQPESEAADVDPDVLAGSDLLGFDEHVAHAAAAAAAAERAAMHAAHIYSTDSMEFWEATLGAVHGSPSMGSHMEPSNGDAALLYGQTGNGVDEDSVYSLIRTMHPSSPPSLSDFRAAADADVPQGAQVDAASPALSGVVAEVDPLQAYRERRRRERNAMEQERRVALRSLYVALRDELPDLRSNEEASRLMILRSANQHIHQLARRRAELQQQKASLEADVAELRTQLSARDAPASPAQLQPDDAGRD